MKSFEFLDPELSAGIPEGVVVGKVALVVRAVDGSSEASPSASLLREV